MSLRELKSKPYVSAILVGINVLVFIACHFIGPVLYGNGNLVAAKVLADGEYGRILWSMFLHADIQHLFNNMLVLFFLGSMLERVVGHTWFCITYFVAGICGNLLSLTWKVITANPAGSLGASGAVFGLDGLLLALVIFHGRRLNIPASRVLLMIALSLYSGFTGGHIDNAAHVGGLIAGFIMGVIIRLVMGARQRRKVQ